MTALAISCCYQPKGFDRDATIGFLLLSDVRGVVGLSIAQSAGSSAQEVGGGAGNSAGGASGPPEERCAMSS